MMLVANAGPRMLCEDCDPELRPMVDEARAAAPIAERRG